MSPLREIVGGENILAQCSGLNYAVYVTDSRLLVGKRFTKGEDYLNVPHSSVNTLELITKSAIPPLTVAMVLIIGAVLVWSFPGGQRLQLPPFPWDIVLVGLIAACTGAIVNLWGRRRIAILRIGISGLDKPITVRLVSVSKAADVFRALKG